MPEVVALVKVKAGVLVTSILVLEETCVNTMTTSKAKTVMSRVTVQSQNLVAVK